MPLAASFKVHCRLSLPSHAATADMPRAVAVAAAIIISTTGEACRISRVSVEGGMMRLIAAKSAAFLFKDYKKREYRRYSVAYSFYRDRQPMPFVYHRRITYSPPNGVFLLALFALSPKRLNPIRALRFFLAF